MTPETLDAAHARLRAAWDGAGGLPVAERRAALKRLRGAVLNRAEAFASALDADFGGRCRHETLIAEVMAVAGAVDHAVPRLRSWARPERASAGPRFWPARARLVKQPRGVVGVMGPANFPLQLTVLPLVGAVAAGCRVLVRPSELTPAAAALIGDTLAEAFAPDHVATVAGDAATAAAMTRLPLDHLLFTGSTANGRRVMAAASEHLTPVTLELGGKSPAILGPGANLAAAARAIVAGKLLNAGQTCVAPDYVLVPRAARDGFVAAAREAARALYPAPEGPGYTAVRDPAARRRLAALAAGETCVALFDRPVAEPRVAAALVLDPAPDGALMREEIFGPLLPVLAYGDLDEAVALVNARPRPLALYWFGRDGADLARVLARTSSGTVSVNETVLHAAVEALPFGGIGSSGMGSYHGRAGFDTFTHRRPVFVQSRFSPTRLLRPPYGPRADRLLRFLLR